MFFRLAVVFLHLIQRHIVISVDSSCQSDGHFDRVVDHECRLKRIEEILEKFVKIDYTWTQVAVAPSTECNSKNQPPSECPIGWITFNGSCYFFSKDAANFTKADGICVKNGAHLCHIESPGENAFIRGKVKSLTAADWWLGGTDSEQEGTWKWFRSGQLLSFSDFAAGQPDKGHPLDIEHCLDMKKDWDFKWNDEGCQLEINFICEKSLI